MNALLQRAIEHLQKQHPSWIISYTHQVAIDCAKFAEKEIVLIEQLERKAFEAGREYHLHNTYKYETFEQYKEETK